MGEYRNRTTGEVKTQGQWRSENSNMSLPRVWTDATLDALNLDPVLPSPPATVGEFQRSQRDGVEQDANGNWVERHVAVDMFADVTIDGVTTTAEEQKTAYQNALNEIAADTNRKKRNELLSETDYFALSDVTMSAEMTTYRQALRDLPTHANWPNLGDDDWPTKP